MGLEKMRDLPSPGNPAQGLCKLSVPDPRPFFRFAFGLFFRVWLLFLFRFRAMCAFGVGVGIVVAAAAVDLDCGR